MIVRMVFPLIIVSFAAQSAQAQTQLCPWLSTGSARTALGGDVTVTAHSQSNWEGSCRFARQAAGVTQAIDIQVSKVNSHPCPDGGMKLKALGNEAVRCLGSTSSGQRAEIIAGRVRDAYFVITATGLSQSEYAPPMEHSADTYGASLIERLAEQVVGNLY